MENSAAHSKTPSNVAYFALRDRAIKGQDAIPPIRFPWTEELERRRRAVARWRGNDIGLKEAMMRPGRE
jgi:hypothetical protein